MSKKIYGLSRSRDKHGNIVRRRLMDWVNCIQASVNGGTESRQVLIVEVEVEDGQEDNRSESGRARTD